ncbi:MAG: RNA ligase family protein [Clostridia bacterium]|nr:RNA ligase family protein [Clostridia bacterium]
MKQKHYMNIERLKPDYADGFRVGDKIVVQEKVDGANASIRYDKETNMIKAFSRKKKLDCMNNLRGFYEWSQKLDIEKVKSVLGDNLCLFGEWLVLHSVVYPKERYNNFYCYDIYDTDVHKYLTQDNVKQKVAELGLIYVPVFYEGNFISWEHIKSFVGRTNLGGEYGEGVVIKNESRLNDPNNHKPFYVKIVGEKFCETKGHKRNKTIDTDKLMERERQQELAESIVTEARVRKLLHKMVDDGTIRENWDNHDMGTIAKNLGRAIHDDCIKEEAATVNEIGSGFGKIASSISMKIARQILEEKCNEDLHYIS